MTVGVRQGPTGAALTFLAVVVQQLRAHAAVCVSWLKILWMQGWLKGSILRNDELPYYDDGSEFLAKMEKHRRAEGLTRPYGKAAIALGVGRIRPGKPEFIDPDPRDYEVAAHGGLVDTGTGEVFNDPNNIEEIPPFYWPLEDRAKWEAAMAGAEPPGDPPPQDRPPPGDIDPDELPF